VCGCVGVLVYLDISTLCRHALVKFACRYSFVIVALSGCLCFCLVVLCVLCFYFGVWLAIMFHGMYEYEYALVSVISVSLKDSNYLSNIGVFNGLGKFRELGIIHKA
jgi:hypothetical protein